MVGTESRCRGRSVEENLRLWGEMFAGSEEGTLPPARLLPCLPAAPAVLRSGHVRWLCMPDPAAFWLRCCRRACRSQLVSCLRYLR